MQDKRNAEIFPEEVFSTYVRAASGCLLAYSRGVATMYQSV
jgi:hypothetical protein